MLLYMVRGAALAAVLIFASSATAGIVSIPGLFATGVDDDGNALSSGQIDTHYTILETGTNAVVVTPSGAWLPNSPTSMWIWETVSGQPTNVTRTFRLTFDLAGLDHTTAAIAGTWATDNTGADILINGMSTGNTSGGFNSFANFSVNSGFVAGVNTLDFVVNDFGVIAGFHVGSIAGTAMMIPAPGTAAFLLGFGLIAPRRRR
jgi:hypothetical protein